MAHRKLARSLIMAVTASIITFGALQTAVFAGEMLLSANNQSAFSAYADDPEINQQLAQVRRATAKYHDINVAIEEGFVVLGIGGCVGDEHGATGIHYVNIPRVLQQGVIAEEPETLTYIPIGNGNLRLVAVEYFNRALYIDTRPPTTPGYRSGTFPSRLEPLPPYLQEVSGPFTLFNQPPDGPFIVTGLTPWGYGIHAWIWSPNPNGMFTASNPRLSCTENN